MVEEAVELRLGKCLQFKRNIVTQLEEGFEAAVRDELRGIKTAAEQAPAVAAHFGHQQRSHGVLSIGGDQRRERRKRQRLQPRYRQLHFAEIDPPVDARRKVLSVLGGAEAADVEIALALANDGVAQSGFGVEAFGPVVQELELFGSGAPEAVACGGEVGQALAGQDLPVIRGIILQLPRLERAGSGERESVVAMQEIIDGGAGQKLQRTTGRSAAIVDAGKEINRLVRDLDHEDRSPDLGWMRLDAVLELEAGQVARQQEIAL